MLMNPQQALENVQVAEPVTSGRLQIFGLRWDADEDLDYTTLDLTMADIASIQYLDMQAIKGDLTDPMNYFWNDKYDMAEAGSPYFDGLSSIYELDTIRFGAISVIPAPGTLALLVAAFGLSARRRRQS